MTQEQIAYANFIKTICESYNCADATKPLQEGFAALCEAQAMFEGEKWDSFKKKAKTAGLAGALALGSAGAYALNAIDQQERDKMMNDHKVFCGLEEDPYPYHFDQEYGSDEAVQVAYDITDKLCDYGMKGSLGRTTLKLQDKLINDRRAVEDATDDVERQNATAQLNKDIRQAERALHMVENNGTCIDGKHVYARPKSGLERKW